MIPSPDSPAALELIGIESCKDIAEVIVGRRSMAKRPKPSQKLKLLFAKQRDIESYCRILVTA